MGIKTSALIVALFASAIAGVLSYFGLTVDQALIEDAIEEQVQSRQTADIAAVRVVEVIDGDTIRVASGNGIETVRLIGIDAPEVAGSPRGAECYGRESSEAATALLTGRKVTLTNDPTQDTRDTYDRLLAFVAVDGQDVGETLIRGGYATEFTYQGRAHQQQAMYRAAEEVARENLAGLWEACIE